MQPMQSFHASTALHAIVAADDPVVRYRLDLALAAMGATVRVATSGWELLSLLADDPDVDVVIAEAEMTMPSGIEALAMARTAGLTVPFVLVVGGAAPALRTTARRLHAAVVAEPLRGTELAQQIRAAVMR
jgi:CheY-like chemotaxis protein